MWNKISDIPVWYADYLESISDTDIRELDIADANAIWELMSQINT